MSEKETDGRLKLYIVVHEAVPTHMVPVLVAHSVLTADMYFTGDTTYKKWRLSSYKKVVVVANNKEFTKHRCSGKVHCTGYENSVLNGKDSCIVYLPMLDEERPNVVKFANTWGK